ncbi:MAG: hypothetical protein ABNH02_11625 [Pseudomonadales bacterium]|jgi:hypothetical protein
MNKIFPSIALMLLASQAQAVELIDDHLRLSGFGTFGVTQSDNPTPYYLNRNIVDDVCYDCDTILGLQLDARFLDSFKASVQIVKRPEDSFSDPSFEWAYLGWEATDNLELRAGRLRIPLQLASDYYFVGQSYPWLRLPSEVYNASAGVNYFEGVSASYRFELGELWTGTFIPFYGFEQTNELDRLHEFWEIKIDYLRGFSIRIEDDSLTTQISYLDTQLINETTYTGGGIYELGQITGMPTTISSEFEFQLLNLGVIYTVGAWELWSEWGASKTKSDFGEGKGRVGYVGAGYHIGTLTPYALFAKDYSEGAAASASTTAGLRWDVQSNVSINLEYTYTKLDGEFDPTNPFAPQPHGQFVYSPYDYSVGFNPISGPSFDWFTYGQDHANVFSLGVNFTF